MKQLTRLAAFAAFAALGQAAMAADVHVLNKPLKPAALRALLTQWRARMEIEA